MLGHNFFNFFSTSFKFKALKKQGFFMYVMLNSCYITRELHLLASDWMKTVA